MTVYGDTLPFPTVARNGRDARINGHLAEDAAARLRIGRAVAFHGRTKFRSGEIERASAHSRAMYPNG